MLANNSGLAGIRGGAPVAPASSSTVPVYNTTGPDSFSTDKSGSYGDIENASKNQTLIDVVNGLATGDTTYSNGKIVNAAGVAGLGGSGVTIAPNGNGTYQVSLPDAGSEGYVHLTVQQNPQTGKLEPISNPSSQVSWTGGPSGGVLNGGLGQALLTAAAIAAAAYTGGASLDALGTDALATGATDAGTTAATDALSSGLESIPAGDLTSALPDAIDTSGLASTGSGAVSSGLSDPYALSSGSNLGFQQSLAPSVPGMGGGTGITATGETYAPGAGIMDSTSGYVSPDQIDLGNSTLSQSGLTSDGATNALGNPSSFINDPATLGVSPSDVIGSTSSGLSLSNALGQLGKALGTSGGATGTSGSGSGSVGSGGASGGSGSPGLSKSEIQMGQKTPLNLLSYNTGSILNPTAGLNDPNLTDLLLNSSGLGHYAKGGDVHTEYEPGEEPMFVTGHTGHYVDGPGTGQSDSIPARLAQGEYVMDAETVSALGDGSNKAGARVLDKMRLAIRDHKRSAPLDSIPPKAKEPWQYMRDGMKMKKES